MIVNWGEVGKIVSLSRELKEHLHSNTPFLMCLFRVVCFEDNHFNFDFTILIRILATEYHGY